MAKEDFNKLFRKFSEIKAGVIGDVMLDTYWWGTVDRISPEAPVPIVSLKKKEHRLGGAANVALNVKALGARVSIFSLIGNDEDGQMLEGLFKEQEISTEYLLRSTKRITTSKSRIISRNQQMLRLDAEIVRDLDPADEQRLIDAVTRYVEQEQPQVMIFEDYNKGVLTRNVIDEVIKICNAKGVTTTVDPKRKNFFSFQGVTVFKPNLKEVREALNIIDENFDKPALKNIHGQLKERLQHRVSFITLSEHGVFYQDEEEADIVPAHVRNIADVSGAGDTVIAVASLVYAATKDTRLMASIANLAGGIVCEEVGTVAIDKKKLLQECKELIEEKE
ncbi:MAG TPA: PfkB family carbohydrate kinase [Chitinophagaceae bacterium]|nr:PfkB family carbohydrate kinase [Chitinophagaceae bacterium]